MAWSEDKPVLRSDTTAHPKLSKRGQGQGQDCVGSSGVDRRKPETRAISHEEAFEGSGYYLISGKAVQSKPIEGSSCAMRPSSSVS